MNVISVAPVGYMSVMSVAPVGYMSVISVARDWLHEYL